MDMELLPVFWLWQIMLPWHSYTCLSWTLAHFNAGCKPNCGIAGSWCSVYSSLVDVAGFSKLFYLLTLLPEVCESSGTLQHLVFSIFLITAILGDEEWYLIVVLVCIFLMTDEVEHLFVGLLPFGQPLLWNVCSSLLSIWRNWVVCLFHLFCKSSLFNTSALSGLLLPSYCFCKGPSMPGTACLRTQQGFTLWLLCLARWFM